MKKILYIAVLLLSITCQAQRFYYGGSGGTGIVKAYNADTKETTYGANDLFISATAGWAFVKDSKDYGWLLETQMQGTISGSITLTAMAGGKIDFTEHCGLHMLAGYADDVVYTNKPFQLIHTFHPAATIRIWIGQVTLQTTYVDHAYYIGVGVIGFKK